MRYRNPVQCTNPDCRLEYFRPFSCKGFYLYPSCSQKRTLLFAEYLDQQLLLTLPHRQFVFSIPKALRVFFRHDQRLFCEVSSLIFSLITGFYQAAAGLLRWRHSGFSVNNSVRMEGDDHKARVSLAQYIARAPLSLEKLHYDQQAGLPPAGLPWMWAGTTEARKTSVANRQ